MYNLGVSLTDYQSGPLDNGATFGTATTTPEALAQLSKALEAGSVTGREVTNLATTGAQALKVESLERNLKNITFKESDIVLWTKIPKLPAYNTVEEYNQLVSYGADAGGFTIEGELPQEEDSVYTRRAQLVKFLGVTKAITHPMTLTNTTVGPLMQREITNGTLWILRKVNRSLTVGNESIVPQEFNGLYTQHAANDQFSSLDQYFQSNTVVDLRGGILGESAIENAANAIIENFGFGDLLMAPPRVLTDFVKSFYGNKFVPLPGGNIDSTVGHRVRKFASQYGDIDIAYDKFMNPSPPRQLSSPATGPAGKAPNAPTTGSAAAVTDTTTLMTAGSYYYAVSALNRFGESQLLSINSSVLALLSTQAADLTFSDGGGTYPATGYVIYRTQNSTAASPSTETFYPMFSVSIKDKTAGYDGAVAGKVRDKNRFIPNTYQAFLIENDADVYSFKQLAPLMKMDLALLGPAYRFMVLLYGTPMLYAPRKMTRFINIGRAAGSASLNPIY